MFDKFRERWAKFEEDHEKVRQAHEHVVRYQVVYGAVGGSILTFVVVRTFGGPQVIVKAADSLPSVINNSPVFNNMPVINNDNSSVVNFGGRLTKIVKCRETGEMWEKVTQAAESAKTSQSYMSRHLHGYKPDVHGLHYEIVGVSTTG